MSLDRFTPSDVFTTEEGAQRCCSNGGTGVREGRTGGLYVLLSPCVVSRGDVQNTKLQNVVPQTDD